MSKIIWLLIFDIIKYDSVSSAMRTHFGLALLTYIMKSVRCVGKCWLKKCVCEMKQEYNTLISLESCLGESRRMIALFSSAHEHEQFFSFDLQLFRAMVLLPLVNAPLHSCTTPFLPRSELFMLIIIITNRKFLCWWFTYFKFHLLVMSVHSCSFFIILYISFIPIFFNACFRFPFFYSYFLFLVKSWQNPLFFFSLFFTLFSAVVLFDLLTLFMLRVILTSLDYLYIL